MQKPFFQFTRQALLIKSQIHHHFQNSPKVVNAVTGFLTFSAGDLLIQSYEKKKHSENFHYLRAFQLGMLGMIMNGFFLVSWYRILDRVVGHSMMSASKVSMKVIADQLVYAPFSIVAFFGYSSVIRYNDLQESSLYFENKMKNHFWSTFFADCTVWPLVNVVTFRYITLAYRPTFTAMAQLLWQAYMSFIADKKRA